MKRKIKIHYKTDSDSSIVLLRRNADGKLEAIETTADSENYNTYTDDGSTNLTYRWGVKTTRGIEQERHDRYMPASSVNTIVTDIWRTPGNGSDALRCEAFADAVFDNKENLEEAKIPANNNLVIRLSENRVPKDTVFCVVSKQLISWNRERAFLMTQYQHGIWQVEIPSSILMREFEFKFGMWDTQNNTFVDFEDGENHIEQLDSGTQNVLNFNQYNFKSPWRVAGVAVPVFSLRTTKSRGCGEYLDMKALADWCERSGLKVIQLLPINDTTATYGWRDSYPYNAISCMALHPSYINVDDVYAYYGKKMSATERENGLYINDLNQVDYIRTREWKQRNLRKIFDDIQDQILADAELQKYMANNKKWVCDYALFTTLRDIYGTPDFRKWEKMSDYNAKYIDEVLEPKSEYFKDVWFRIFLQFHAERQINEAIEYAHQKNIAIKGDLPIGINPNSVEAWVEPEFFNFGMQAGAPPDFFSRDGQNWGFPIYNWHEMSKDGYSWWKRRLGRMQQFFDLFRIDHILGFFRIWAIPHPFKSGLMGIFAPALPYSSEELATKCINAAELSKPIVTEEFLYRQLEEYGDKAKKDLFTCADGWCALKDEYFDPNATNKWIEDNVGALKRDRIRSGFNNILHEVLFVSVKENEYHPRIMLTETDRFANMPPHMQEALRSLHDDFFFNRHNEFWRENAVEHLEAMMSHCKMLVCGEDLGMIPASVPEVMRQLQILALEIQRMPKQNWERYGNTERYDYMTVCASSSHDISSIRGWWEENHDETQWYYNNILHHQGTAPLYAPQDIVREVMAQHLNSPSMLCINPIQDYAGMVDHMPHLLPGEERINNPADNQHKWRYRIPFCIDELEAKHPEMEQITKRMVENSGRLQ